MNIMDLEEADGLTRQAIVTYLGSSWYHAAGDPIERWDKINCAGDVSIWIDPDDLGVAIKGLSRVEKRSPQAILREMNPRWRKGVPIASERSAHALWLCRSAVGRLMIGRFEEDKDFGLLFRADLGRAIMSAQGIEQSSFWPCDDNGNRIPVPHA